MKSEEKSFWYVSDFIILRGTQRFPLRNLICPGLKSFHKSEVRKATQIQKLVACGSWAQLKHKLGIPVSESDSILI